MSDQNWSWESRVDVGVPGDFSPAAVVKKKEAEAKIEDLIDQFRSIHAAMKPMKGHFCDQWDGMYIFEGMSEMEACCDYPKGALAKVLDPSLADAKNQLIRAAFEALEVLEDMEASGIIPQPNDEDHNGWYLGLNRLRMATEPYRFEIRHGKPAE